MVTIIMFRSRNETSKVRYKFVYHPEVRMGFSLRRYWRIFITNGAGGEMYEIQGKFLWSHS